ncbi:MAG: oligosaccharide flippase family protein [Saprospiraceae bacterium]|nr:oligosaccharide flippase family protein [Saprospiraceae bacterium]
MIAFKQILLKINWSSISSITFIGLQAIVFIVLTQLISTESFGIYALSSAIVLFGVSIIENSFPSSLIHSKNPTYKDYNAVLSINLSLAFGFTLLILLILAGFLYYSSFTILRAILVILPCLFLAAYNSVQYAGLKNQLDFKSIAKIEMASSAIYILMVSFLAFLGLEYWALIISLLIKHFVVFVILKTRKLEFSTSIVKLKGHEFSTHWQYGKYVVGEKSASALLSYADSFIIAHFLGMSTLGLYDVLKKIILRPIILLYNGLEQVFFPLLSSMSHDRKSYLNLVTHLYTITRFFFAHLSCIIYLLAPQLLHFLPTEYSNSIAVIRWLAIYSFVIILFNPLDILMYSMGQTKLFFKWLLSYCVPLLLVTGYFASFGLVNMLVAITIFYSLLYIVSYFVLRRSIKIPKEIYFLPILHGVVAIGLTSLLSIYSSNNLITSLIVIFSLIIVSTFSILKRIRTN